MPEFADATIGSVQIDVGSYNQGPIAYFDDVTISRSFGDGHGDLTLYLRARNVDKPSESECSDEDAKLELRGSIVSGSAGAGVDPRSWKGPDCP